MFRTTFAACTASRCGTQAGCVEDFLPAMGISIAAAGKLSV
jgi:hypothetical protein